MAAPRAVGILSGLLLPGPGTDQLETAGGNLIIGSIQEMIG